MLTKTNGIRLSPENVLHACRPIQPHRETVYVTVTDDGWELVEKYPYTTPMVPQPDAGIIRRRNVQKSIP